MRVKNYFLNVSLIHFWNYFCVIYMQSDYIHKTIFILRQHFFDLFWAHPPTISQYPPSIWFFSLINKVPYILLISNIEFSFGHTFGFWSIWPERIRLKISRKPDQRHIYYSTKGPTNFSFFFTSYLWKDPNQIVLFLMSIKKTLKS